MGTAIPSLNRECEFRVGQRQIRRGNGMGTYPPDEDLSFLTDS